jgi:hypothetical protein
MSDEKLLLTADSDFKNLYEQLISLAAAHRSKLAAQSSQLNKKPTGCLLGACSGQHPMGYRFSLLTLLFSGVCKNSKHRNRTKFRLIL